jgi:DeoR/GlpR family transcriptional regulator of sugar metabolism
VKTKIRLDHIVSLVDESGFISVADLSRLCDVSKMTIRRDLALLDDQKRIRRTYGGAVSLRAEAPESDETRTPPLDKKTDVRLVDQVDVLIGTSVNPYYDSLLIDRATKKNIPLIAESIEMPNQRTIVAVDNYQAGLDMGRWAGQHICEEGIGQANLLDLTFHQPNTRARSRGFVDGLQETCPDYKVVLSINAQSRYATAYQLARDALSVYPEINLIFAINDITAWGAINACRDLQIDPKLMTVITFGLEGDTLKNELAANLANGHYCKAGLAMFPEIVGQTCIQAAIAAYNGQSLPAQFVTPYVVLTAQNLSEYYLHTPDGWKLQWETVRERLKLPIPLDQELPRPGDHLPDQIGLIVPFIEHEWYKNLKSFLKAYAGQYRIGLQVIDAEQNVRDEVEFRRRQIARKAASLVEAGDVILVDGGPISVYLADELKNKKGITVITNSVIVFDVLNRTPGIILISTGGAVRYSTQVLVGPTAERALKELRADKLFLMVSGITLDFGLSHHTISEVTIKQAMLRSAREVILLADHTAFEAEGGIQVAPLTVVNRLITDDALPPSARLDLIKQGIQIILAEI